MNLVRLADAPLYDPRNHPGVIARRIQGREAGGPRGVYVSLSEYPPGSGGSSVTATTEVVYVVIEGTMRIEHDNGFDELSAGDSIAFEPGESRSAHNLSDTMARLIVIHQPDRS